MSLAHDTPQDEPREAQVAPTESYDTTHQVVATAVKLDIFDAKFVKCLVGGHEPGNMGRAAAASGATTAQVKHAAAELQPDDRRVFSQGFIEGLTNRATTGPTGVGAQGDADAVVATESEVVDGLPEERLDAEIGADGAISEPAHDVAPDSPAPTVEESTEEDVSPQAAAPAAASADPEAELLQVNSTPSDGANEITMTVIAPADQADTASAPCYEDTYRRMDDMLCRGSFDAPLAVQLITERHNPQYIGRAAAVLEVSEADVQRAISAAYGTAICQVIKGFCAASDGGGPSVINHAVDPTDAVEPEPVTPGATTTSGVPHHPPVGSATEPFTEPATEPRAAATQKGHQLTNGEIEEEITRNLRRAQAEGRLPITMTEALKDIRVGSATKAAVLKAMAADPNSPVTMTKVGRSYLVSLAD